MHSPEYERIKRLYNSHRLTETGVLKAVERNLITQEEADEILGVAESE